MKTLRSPPPAPPRRALLVVLGLSLCLMPASAAAKGAEAKLRGSGASDSEGASASAVSAPFLSQLAVHKAAGLTTEELKEKIKNDPLLLHDIAAATATAAAAAAVPPATSDASSLNIGTDDWFSSSHLPEVREEADSCAETATNSTIMVGNVIPKGKTPKGQEFLGVGYNALTGNPRGDLTSNFDPGFGFRVITLAKGAVKVRGLLEPTTAAIKPIKMCSFSSEAKDISSAKDMQDTLNKESSDDTTVSASFGVMGFGFDSSNQFSKSEKMNKFKQETENEQTVSFEASAMCIDFRETINPYLEKTIDPAFNDTINTLGAAIGRVGSYDSSLHKAAFTKFFKVYGTHYITEIDMGGKYIITTEMSAKDVSSLTTEQVDIASALSFDQSFSFMGSENKEKATLREAKRDFYKPTCCGNKMEAPPKDDSLFKNLGKEVKDKLPFSFSVGVQSTHKRSSSRSSRASESVKSKMTKQSIYTLGGLPPTDPKSWATWAASVENIPMPVAYKYAPIWELVEFKAIAGLRKAYMDAFLDVYKVPLVGASEYGEPAFRSGVVRSSGEPISRSAQTSDRRKRLSLELELLASTEFAHDTVQVCLDESETQDVKNSWSSFATATEVEEGFFACGLRAKIEPLHKTNLVQKGRGLTGLDVKFCSIEKWTNQETKVVYTEASGWVQPWKMCEKDQYIVQIKPTVKFDELGIESLRIKCATKDGYIPSNDVDKFHDVVPMWPWWARRVGTAMEAQPTSVIPGQLIRSLRTQYEEGGRKGIKGMEVILGDADLSDTHGGPPSPIFFYRSYWDLRTTKASPIFATPVRGKIGKSAYESSQLSFTSKRGGLMVESLSMYAYMDDTSRPKLVVTDFKNDVSESDLQPFGMLVLNELDDEARKHYGLQGRYIRGIFHPGGYDVTFSQEAEYEVEFEDSAKPSLATVILKGLSSSHVTLLASPIWFPGAGEGKYPNNAGDVAIATSPCEAQTNVNSTDWRCYVHVGSEGNSNAAKHLGFSFMAIGSDDNEAGRKNMTAGYFGTVGVKKDEGFDPLKTKTPYVVDPLKTKTSKGVTTGTAFNKGKQFSVMAGEGDLVEINVSDQVTGGIRLAFDPPFKDIPSIIVSPIIDKTASLSRHATDVLSLPSTVVEHVTPKEALIRVGLVNTQRTGLKAKLDDSCTSVSSVHQTFTADFRVSGTIGIGKSDQILLGAKGKCFAQKAGYVDAEECNENASNQNWVYDGTRIRSAQDPSKCIWGRDHDGRLAIHTCLSNKDSVDDERFNFRQHPSKDYMNIDNMYSRCVYLEGTHVKLSIKHDSRCHDGRSPEWSRIIVQNGFLTLTTPAGDAAGGAKGKCFAQKAGYVDAEECNENASNQKWVYDGTRVRSAQDPSKCIWGRGQDGRLAIHTCLSNKDSVDDERFNFRQHPSKDYMNIDNMYSRCVYLEGTHVKLSIKHDSRCHDGRSPEWSGIVVPNGFLTSGFQIKTSEKEANKPVNFNKCLAWLPSKNTFDPLSSCNTSAMHPSAFLLTKNTSDATDKTDRLKLADHSPSLYFSKEYSSGEPVMNELASSTASVLDIDFQVIFENHSKSLQTKLMASRLKVDGKDECLAWGRFFQEAVAHDVKELFEPISFSVAAVGPL